MVGPWLTDWEFTEVHLHHISKGVELDEQELVHLNTTSTRVEAGGAPRRSLAYAKGQSLSDAVEDWAALLCHPPYSSHHFLPVKVSGQRFQPHFHGGGDLSCLVLWGITSLLPDWCMLLRGMRLLLLTVLSSILG